MLGTGAGAGASISPDDVYQLLGEGRVTRLVHFSRYDIDARCLSTGKLTDGIMSLLESWWCINILIDGTCRRRLMASTLIED